MIFADRGLAQRLERAEGNACLEFAQARRKLFPEAGSAWIEHAGTIAVFDGIGAPTTQTFCLGLFEEVSDASLDVIELFFRERKAHVDHEVSPLVGVQALDLLCSRGYKPLEVSNVMYRRVEKPAAKDQAHVQVRVTAQEDAHRWAEVSARGWGHEYPELAAALLQSSTICTAREKSPCFLAEFDGQPGAAGVLSMHEGVALFGGSATVPELRRRGLQAALLDARMNYAFAQGCDLAMMVAEAGSNSQRNAERKGFQVAYTRLKWRLLKTL